MRAASKRTDPSERMLRALAAGHRPTHLLDVAFTGSGSEYFRIWVVNLLLLLVTLGLYYPWAKVRRLRYFYGSTRIDGQPLDFHGSPLKMLRGHLLVGVLLVLYSVAGNFSPLAGLLAFLIVALIWPALLKASMQFKLANTSWRGLRFRFTGSTADAYRALWPMFLTGLLLVAGTLAVEGAGAAAPWQAELLGGLVLASVLLLPWFWFRLKRYQHRNFAFGQLQTELRTNVRASYGIFVRAVGVMLLVLASFAGLIVLAGGIGFAGLLASDPRQAMAAGLLLTVLALLGLALALQIVVGPYLACRMQNLLWSRTGNRDMRLRSQLRLPPWLALHLKNWLLIVLTLGLYWPYAAIATARMRLQAVQVVMRVDPSDLVESTRAAQGDAAGEAAGDLLGLDLGL